MEPFCTQVELHTGICRLMRNNQDIKYLNAEMILK